VPIPLYDLAIIGGGINGCGIARDAAGRGLSVFLCEQNDLASGTSSWSTKLIHGGLRYLEYGDVRLVRESLEERTRLLKLAPHLVQPLKLHIPIARRTGGLLQAGLRFLGLSRLPGVRHIINRWPIASARGLWAVRIGLAMYDWIARGSELPRHSVARLESNSSPAVDRAHFRWVCSYWDAQMPAPERFVIALLRDAANIAREAGVRLEVLPYHRARLSGDRVELIRTLGTGGTTVSTTSFRPSAIVNATGPWGDHTLAELPTTAPRLCGGTKGSHFVTHQATLTTAIGGDGIYAEARDGRLVFILPWNGAVLVGTTDERFSGRPDDATASEAELTYLIGLVNELFPQVTLKRADIDLHYSGVRPLPFVPAGKTGAIPRDHSIDVRRTESGITIYSLIGGKLTTCRAFGEIVADTVLRHLGRERTADTRDRPVPGSQKIKNAADIESQQQRLAESTGLEIDAIRELWSLLGDELADVLSAATKSDDPDQIHCLPGTAIPLAVVDAVIAREWVTTTADLIERRLMLAFSPHLSRETVLALEARLRAIRGDGPRGADHAIERLREHYGIHLEGPRGNP
jgi:glycerol-3-phosphate dehydrogenase